MQPDQGVIAEENDLYESISGAASTANTFYPYKDCVETPVAILQKFVTDLEDLGTVDDELTKHQYVLGLGKEVIQALRNGSVSPERKRELLFRLYLHCCIASAALQDRFGCISKYYAKFSSREEAVVFGWTLSGSKLTDEDKKEMLQRVADYYAERGVRLAKGEARNGVASRKSPEGVQRSSGSNENEEESEK